MDVQIKQGKFIYAFQRDAYGEGRWSNITKGYDGSIGSSVANTYVHLQLNSELTKIAVQSGLGSYEDFRRFPIQKRTEEVVTRVRSFSKSLKRSRKVTGGLKLFSLFDSLEDNRTPRKVVYEEIPEASSNVQS